MSNLSRVVGAALIVLGLALFTWLAYDATVVMETLRLAAVASEGAVATVGLWLAAGLVGAGAVCLRRAARRAAGHHEAAT
jgi:hypothetical protein